jgi:hypothetical protein
MNWTKFRLLIAGLCAMSVGSAIAEDVTINSDKSASAVLVGSIPSGDSSDNSVTVTETGKAFEVVVGQTQLGDTHSNKATGTGGEITNDLQVGITRSGSASDNSINYTNGRIGSLGAGNGNNGESSNNVVTLDNVTLTNEFSDSIIGFNSGLVADNKFTATNGTQIAGGVRVGISTGSGAATRNIIELDRVGAMSGAVVAGMTYSGDATKNSITQIGGSVSGNEQGYGIIAGLSNTGSASENTVTLSGVSVAAGVAAGFSVNGSADNNAVTMSGGSADSVNAGIGFNGSASGNIVDLEYTKVTGTVSSGRIVSGDAKNNTITLTGGTAGLVQAGEGTGGESSNNVVTLDNVALTDESSASIIGQNSGLVADNKFTAKNGTKIAGGVIVGANSGAGAATRNSIELDNVGAMNGAVVAGVTSSGDATKNSITQTGGSVSGNEQGYGVLAGFSPQGSASENTVTLSSVAVSYDVGAGISLDGATDSNVVTMTGGSANSVAAGYGSAGTANTNTVTLTGVDVLDSVRAGVNAASANENSVTILGGSINGRIQSGFGSSASSNGITVRDAVFTGKFIESGNAASGDSTKNFISIHGGTLGQDTWIRAGYSVDGHASDNTVTLAGDIDIHASTKILGGEIGASSSGISSGNKLEILTGKAMTLTEINWFQDYSFVLNPDIASTPFITVTGAATNLDGARITILDFVAGGPVMNQGDEFTIISNVTGNVAETSFSGRQGLVLLHDYTLSSTGGKLVGTIARTRVDPQSKALSQFRIAGLVGLNQAGDLVAGQAMASASAVAAAGKPSLFSAVSASDSRTKTGSFIDTTGVNFLLGLAYRFQRPDAGPLAAIFMETGYNRHDSENESFAASTIQGKGNHKYLGGGLSGRWDKMFAGLYSEGSLRIGYNRSTSRIDNYQTADGGKRIPEYRLRGLYYGAHAGLGYELSLPNCFTLDLSARYFWNHQKGDNLSLMNDPIRFDSVDSHRVRVGGRLAWKGGWINPYAGAYFEREYHGKATATHYQYSLESPSMRGNTGLFEAGLELKPESWSQRASLDMGATANVGRRKGIGGHVAFRWEF